MASPGKRRAEKPARSGLGTAPYLAALFVGMIGSVIAWLFLVSAAIDFGHAARHGQSIAWAFTLGATLGAIACLLLFFALVARVRTRLAVTHGPKPARSSGGRRAVR